jgi:pimeloyl-ACP methyl ester carboxylesterase
MPKYWMINDRSNGGVGPDVNFDGVTYWVSDKRPLTDINNWRKVTAANFQKLLVAAADKFPAHSPADNEKQSHVTILVHGFNNKFSSAAGFYQQFCDKLFDGPDSLGLCILYDWPSRGSILGYEPDRSHARLCAHDLTDVLSALFDWLVAKQQATIDNPAKACKAKVSLIAHSMGNYVVQKAMAAAWTRKNQPLLVSLINQLVMVAADVDSDLFDAGAPDNDDGSAVANLTYRITALYSGLCPGRVCRFETFRYPASWSQRSSESSASGRCVVANGQCLGCGLFQLFPASSRRRRNSRSLFRQRRHNQSYAPRSARARPWRP